MKIRAATEKDVDRLALLCTALGYSTTSAEMATRFSEVEQCDEHAVFVAEAQDQTLVGWVHVYHCKLLISAPQAIIFGLVVDEQFQRQGIGRSLLEQVERWAVSRNCSTILVRSNMIRTEAHRFYEQVGYKEIKRSLVFQKQV